MFARIILTLNISLMLLMLTCNSRAQTTDDIRSHALNTVDSLIKHRDFNSISSSTQNSLLIDMIFNDDLETFYKITKSAKVDTLYKHLRSCIALQALDISAPCYKEINNISDSNFQDRHNKLIAQAIIHLRKYDSVGGLEKASLALKNIPPDTSIRYANEYYEAYYLLHLAYAHDHDIEGLLNATSETVKYSKLTGRKFNVYNVLYNISKLFNDSNDPETAINIINAARPLPDNAIQQDKFIINYAIGSYLIKNNEYEKAISFLEMALSQTKAPHARISVLMNLSKSNAFTGKVKAAKNNIKMIMDTLPAEQTASQDIIDQLSLTRSELARLDGDYISSYNFYKEYSDNQLNALTNTLTNSRAALNKKVKLQQLQSEAAIQTLNEKRRADTYKRQLTYVGIIILVALIIALFNGIKYYRNVSSLLKANAKDLKESSQIKSTLKWNNPPYYSRLKF